MRQPLQYVVQPRIGFLAAELGGLDQTVDLRSRRRTFRRVAKQPVLAPDYKRSDRTLDRIVVDGQNPASV